LILTNNADQLNTNQTINSGYEMTTLDY